MKTLARSTLITMLAAALLAPRAFASSASARVAALVRAGDFESAIAAANPNDDPNDVELAAWLIAARLRTGDWHEQLAAARKLTAAHPENPWSWFALVHALSNTTDSAELLGATETMLRTAGDDPPSDLIALRSGALMNADREEEARKLLDAALARHPDDATLLVARGDAAAENDQLAFYLRARRADPANANAWAREGTTLLRRRRGSEAVEALQRAIELAPRAVYTRQSYWRALHGAAELTQAQKELAIEADLDAFVRDRGDLPSTFSAIAREYHQLKLRDRQCAAEERVLREAPHSMAAAQVLYARAVDFREGRSEEELQQPKIRDEYRRLLRAVLADPQRSTAMHGTVAVTLLSTMRYDRTVPPGELRETVEQLDRYGDDNPVWRFAIAPSILADHGVALDYAESLARQALPELRKQLESNRAMYQASEDFEEARSVTDSAAHDALGWVLLAEQKMPEAKRELLAAVAANPKNADALYHLGRFYESYRLLTKAMETYAKGALVTNALHNDNRAALKAAYRKRHGSLRGFEAYRKTVDGTDAVERKAKVLASRANPPKPVLPFKLTTLRGSPMTLDDLKGKVSVINFWGIWCGWCVRELPDFQTLARRYSNDPAVRIVTVNNDGDVDKVRDWMTSKKYDFPVLLDDGWLSKISLHSFPTTWFLDRTGRIAFTKVGWSEKLVDEFSWRIEALKRE